MLKLEQTRAPSSRVPAETNAGSRRPDAALRQGERWERRCLPDMRRNMIFFFKQTYLNFKFGMLSSGASLGAVFSLDSGSCWSPVTGVMSFKVGTSASAFGKDGEGSWTDPALLSSSEGTCLAHSASVCVCTPTWRGDRGPCLCSQPRACLGARPQAPLP